MRNKQTYWFPAKRVGWGLGLPTTWQSITALIVYAMLLAVGGAWLARPHANGAFLLYAFVLTGLLVVVCWVKGEPLNGRQGGG